MKQETIFKLAVVVILGALILSAQRAFAQQPPCGRNAETCVIVDVVAEGGDAAAEGGDAVADSYSDSSADSYSEGSESYSEGSSAESYAEGGKGGLSYSASSQGQTQVAGSDVSVGIGGSSLSLGGNNSSFRYDYREAAKTAAALTTAVCQDGTSLQGVKFGPSNP